MTTHIKNMIGSKDEKNMQGAKIVIKNNENNE